MAAGSARIRWEAAAQPTSIAVLSAWDVLSAADAAELLCEESDGIIASAIATHKLIE
jgi:hypothetical protein